MIEFFLADICIFLCSCSLQPFILVDQVTDFLTQLEFAVGARAVLQVSCSYRQVPMGWGIHMHFFCLFSALRSMWEAPDVSIRPSQTKFGAAG